METGTDTSIIFSPHHKERERKKKMISWAPLNYGNTLLTQRAEIGGGVQGHHKNAKRMLQRIRGTTNVEEEYEDRFHASEASEQVKHP
ncbi:hypothetical protein EJ110_NYTH29752 [Nymphaea thermarum]|nr:hypothetical protein EJ110_NYTH29752 [Nymphaea thermarum]